MNGTVCLRLRTENISRQFVGWFSSAKWRLFSDLSYRFTITSG